jgi:acetylglutamate kinase
MNDLKPSSSDNTHSTSPLNIDGQLTIVKIGGNIIDDDRKLAVFLKEFSSVPGRKILVHGGGKLATKVAEEMNVPQQMVDGRRITDEATLKIVTMVYAGYVNKNIVAQLQSSGTNAMGICGADANAIKAHKRTDANLDYGLVGDIDGVNVPLLENLLGQNITLVVAPITHDGSGQLLNTNADTIAQELAKALSKSHSVSLIYSFEKAGVLRDANDDESVINEIVPDTYVTLKNTGAVFAGMIPKLDNAFVALNSGVKKVVIGKAEELSQLIIGGAGTTIRL